MSPQTPRAPSYKPASQPYKPRNEIQRFNTRPQSQVNSLQRHQGDSFDWSGPEREVLFHLTNGDKLPRTVITVNGSKVEAL